MSTIRRRHTISFKHALDGILHTLKHQPNMRLHAISAFLVLLVGIALKVNRFEWLILLFTIMWVMVSEMINTSIEAMVDLISKEYSHEAKIAKDVAAGMVLVGAIGAVVVAVVIFIPKIIALVS
jgi:diacylglycerol kinase